MDPTDYQAAFNAGSKSLKKYFNNQYHSVENVAAARAYFDREPNEEDLIRFFWLHRGNKYKEALKVLKKLIPPPPCSLTLEKEFKTISQV